MHILAQGSDPIVEVIVNGRRCEGRRTGTDGRRGGLAHMTGDIFGKMSLHGHGKKMLRYCLKNEGSVEKLCNNAAIQLISMR